jgi:hypothetical protein
MAKLDLDRIERLAGGLAVLFYALLFLAFITAIMGSGGGGLLLLVLGAAAHVGRVGLEELAAKRREMGGAPASSADDSERATGLRLKWLPREIRFGSARPAGGRSAGGRGEVAGRVATGAGEAAGAALGRAGELLGGGTEGVRTSFAALMAEIRERPARAFGVDEEPEYDFGDLEDVAPQDDNPRAELADFADFADAPELGDLPEPAGAPDSGDSAAPSDAPKRFDDPRFADEPRVRSVPDFGFDEEVAGGVFDGGREFGGDPDSIDVPSFFSEPSAAPGPVRGPEPAEIDEPVRVRARHSSNAKADAPTAQERYEARQRAREERAGREPRDERELVAAAVEATEPQAPQQVRRRKPGARPDPLRTRRPTRAR